MSSAELLWKQCVQWMCGLGVLPQKHKLLTEEANAEMLAYTLRDGVLLCQIANCLSRGCIEARYHLDS
jgi:guanine nucleotide exchange factor VAV